jgi:hypothetical protein
MLRTFLLFAFTLAMSACGSGSVAPALELDLFERAQVAAADRGEPHRVLVQLDIRASELVMRARFVRSSGAVAELVLEIPTATAGQQARQPRASYWERLRGATVFTAHEASGRIELSVDPRCACQTGWLELLLVDLGPDGARGTADDRVRRISRARLRRDERPFCHQRAVLELREGLIVVGTRACPRPAGGVVAAGGSAGAWGASGWIASETWNDGWYDPGWSGDCDSTCDDGWESVCDPGGEPHDGADETGATGSGDWSGGWDPPPDTGSDWDGGWEDESADDAGDSGGGGYDDGGYDDDGGSDDGGSDDDWWDE